MALIPICPLNSFPMAKPVQVSHGDSHVVIVRLGPAEFHAINDVCPHRGAFIGNGPLVGTVLTCPWHDWSFDVTTGECLNNPNACQNRYPIHITDGTVYLELPEAE